MTVPILEVLDRCGVVHAQDEGAWQRLIVLHNLGGLPGNQARGDVLANRGFNLLVVDDAGAPTYFCKFRPAERSESLAERLSHVAALENVIPETRMVRADGIDAEVSRYLAGDLFESMLHHTSSARIEPDLTEIIAISRRISEAAAEQAPWLLGGATRITVADAARWSFDALIGANIAGRDARILAGAIERAGEMPRVLQHGDLWPRNVVWFEHHWWILDLDFYGRVQVPLYDAFHLVRTTWDTRAGRRARRMAWVEALQRDDADARAYRAVLSRATQADGLTHAQAGGAFAYYVVDIAARLFSRRLPDSYVGPHVREIRALARWMESGRAAEDVFLATR